MSNSPIRNPADSVLLALLFVVSFLLLLPDYNWVLAAGETGTGSFEQAGVTWLPAIPVQLTAGVDAGYDDNATISSNGRGSTFARENIVLTYGRPGERTQLYLLGVGRFSQYFDVTGQDEMSGNVTFSLTHNFSSRWSFYANVFASYQKEPNFRNDIGPENVRAAHFDMGDIFALTYHWSSRFSLITNYAFDRVQYSASSAVGASQNRTQDTLGEQLQLSLTSRTNLTGEYRFEIINYDSAPLNSVTHYLLAGVDHHLTEHLIVRAQVGDSVRSLEDQGNSSSPSFEGSLNYGGSNYSVRWTANYGFEAPTAADVSIRKTWRTGLGLTYRLTSRVSSTAVVYYHHDQNEGSTANAIGSQDALEFVLGLRYTINNRFALHADYSHSAESALESMPAYSRNTFSLGLNFTY